MLPFPEKKSKAVDLRTKIMVRPDTKFIFKAPIKKFVRPLNFDMQ
jgi:hypothetical protein